MDNFLAHILVVDDDDGIRSLVKKFLNENSFELLKSAIKFFEGRLLFLYENLILSFFSFLRIFIDASLNDELLSCKIFFRSIK